jgi:hypothetical protein
LDLINFQEALFLSLQKPPKRNRCRVGERGLKVITSAILLAHRKIFTLCKKGDKYKNLAFSASCTLMNQLERLSGID